MNSGKMTSKAAFSAAAALLCVIFSSCDGDEAAGENRTAFSASIQAQDSAAVFETEIMSGSNITIGSEEPVKSNGQLS